MGRGILAITCLLLSGRCAAETADTQLERAFSQTVRPFLTSYCIGCHSGATPAAQFDLRPFTNVAAVVRDYPHWNLLMEKLAANEMPPKPVKQPSADARQAVIQWVRALRTHEAQKNAGDPGP